jgi:hypothetical protein
MNYKLKMSYLTKKINFIMDNLIIHLIILLKKKNKIKTNTY